MCEQKKIDIKKKDNNNLDSPHLSDEPQSPEDELDPLPDFPLLPEPDPLPDLPLLPEDDEPEEPQPSSPQSYNRSYCNRTYDVSKVSFYEDASYKQKLTM